MESRGNANTGQPPWFFEVLALGLKVDPAVNDSELFFVACERVHFSGESSTESVHVVFFCKVQGVCQSCDSNNNLLNYHSSATWNVNECFYYFYFLLFLTWKFPKCQTSKSSKILKVVATTTVSMLSSAVG